MKKHKRLFYLQYFPENKIVDITHKNAKHNKQ